MTSTILVIMKRIVSFGGVILSLLISPVYMFVGISYSLLVCKHRGTIGICALYDFHGYGYYCMVYSSTLHYSGQDASTGALCVPATI